MGIRWIAAVVLALSLAACMPGMNRSASAPPADASVGTVMTFAASATAPASNSCSAPASGYCAGCSVSCPSERPAFCSSGLTDYSPANTGHSPVCRQAARCYCGS